MGKNGQQVVKFSCNLKSDYGFSPKYVETLRAAPVPAFAAQTIIYTAAQVQKHECHDSALLDMMPNKEALNSIINTYCEQLANVDTDNQKLILQFALSETQKGAFSVDRVLINIQFKDGLNSEVRLDEKALAACYTDKSVVEYTLDFDNTDAASYLLGARFGGADNVYEAIFGRGSAEDIKHEQAVAAQAQAKDKAQSQVPAPSPAPSSAASK